MRSPGLRITVVFFLAAVAGSRALSAPAGEPVVDSKAEWKAGAAAAKITPRQMMWMAGYSARKKPAEGVAQDLYAKALALEDAGGRRLVIVTLDLVSVPRTLRDYVERQCIEKFKLARESLLMNASHTHCGPELRSAAYDASQIESARATADEAYMEQLRSTILEVIGQAIGRLAPAKLDYLHARAGFAMNRRRPTEHGFANAPNSDGPVDQQVPVLRVTDEKQAVRAVLFGYACHNTTLSFYQFCGDYAGFAQQYLEEEMPGTVAMFITGCGGDQNPYPRGTIELCRQHGRTLATAVRAALETVPKPLAGPLATAWREVELEFAPPPSREQLLVLAAGKPSAEQSHAKTLLEQIAKDGRIRTTYSYPIQVVHFGDDLTLIALAGEVVVDYSLRLKAELAGTNVWVAAYSNDVFGYVPSRRVLAEGGYEAGGAMLYGRLPGPFAPSVEDRIITPTLEMARRAHP
jgi:hypothetical protein